MTSAVLILPAAYRDAGNAFGVAQGWGEDNFSVPLSPTGTGPTTHWGCRTDVTQVFMDIITNPPQEATQLLGALISSFDDSLAPYDHWVKVLVENDLERVTDERF